MGKWRDAFELNRPSEQDTDYGLEYHFGPPATEQQIAQIEASLGKRLPNQLRELLSEFNGVSYTSAATGEARESLFLDCDEILETFRNLAESGSEFKKVIIFGQDNGFSVMYGVCLRRVAEFAVGSAVFFFDGVLQEEGYPDLLTFVRQHGK
jgi:hypothetical protein